MGNRTAKANLLPSAPAENYTYDAIYQLTQVVQNGSTTSENYTYDPVGNRLSSLAASPWNYNVSNHLTSISGLPGTTFAYDNNGNTTSKTDASGTTTYAFSSGFYRPFRGYSNPTVHYATSLLSVLTILASGESIDADATATRDMTLVEAALAETAVVLKVIRDKCFGCCK